MIAVVRLVLLVILAGGPALAQPRSWAQVAETFGCTQQIQNTPPSGNRPGQLEFIPAGEPATGWSRIFTVTLVAAPQDDAGANEAVERLIQSMRQTISSRGARIAAFDVFRGNRGQIAFVEFVIGSEPNIAVIHRAGPGLLAIQQLATRGKPPEGDDRRRLRALVGLRD